MEILLKVALGMLAKCVSEVFFSKIVAKAMLIYAKQSPNQYDNVVAEAVADAFGMPADDIKKYL